MEALYKAYKDNDKVAIFLVYINEAHPAGAWSEAGAAGKPKGPSDIGQHRNLADRIIAASTCMDDLKLTLPILIDTMDGVTERAYRGRPAATAVVDLEGKIIFYSKGPGGAQPKKAKAVIKKALASWPTSRPSTQPTSRPSTQPTTQPAGSVLLK